MKWLFWILLLSSGIFFAVMRLGVPGAVDEHALQAQAPLNADKIHLLSASAVALNIAAGAAQSAVPATCMEWGGVSAGNLTRASAALSALNLGDNLTQRQVEQITGYWVYLPPVSTRAELEKKIAELNSLGIHEYFVVQEAGKWHNTLSLSVFKSEESALRFLNSIKARGVKAAQMGARKGKVALTVFVVRNPDARVAAKLAELQQEFAASELKAADCAN